MPLHTEFAKRLSIEHAIIQAPMAGGPTSPDLVAAVSNAGGLGCIAGGYLSPDELRDVVRAVRARTSRPFGINIFAPLPPPIEPGNRAAFETFVARAFEMVSRISLYHAELGITPPQRPTTGGDDFEGQMAVVLESGATLFSFTFGLIPPSAVAAAHQRGMLVAGTATTVVEAMKLAELHVDAVVAQGSEAGAHRGTFVRDFESSMIGTMALVPQMCDVVHIPVIASGGIMDGRGLVAALALGAQAVQLGTAFLATNESAASPPYKDALFKAREDQTRVTRVYSGRPARGIVNRLMSELEASGDAPLPYPMQNTLTRPLRREAAKQGRPELLSLYAGQGVPLVRREPAAETIARIVREADAVLRSLT